jgi:ketosteroid isomerase-like protein
MGRLSDLLRPIYSSSASDEGMAHLAAIAHPDFEMRTVGLWLDDDRREYRGLGQVREFFDSLEEAFDFRFEQPDFTEEGDTVTVSFLLSLAGRHSGIRSQRGFTHTWRFEEGRALSVVVSLPEDDA